MSDSATCPDCAEEIRPGTPKCPHCGSTLSMNVVVGHKPYQQPKGLLTRRVSCVGAMLVYGGGLVTLGSGLNLADNGPRESTVMTFVVALLVVVMGIVVVRGDFVAPDERTGFFAAPLWQSCLAFVGIVGVLFAFALYNLDHRHGGGNETAAIGGLKTIGTAQMLFREADKEEDGNLDYGTLMELSQAGHTGLIDQVLGSGTKNGYLFKCTYGVRTSEFIWFATATPALPGVTGDRYFAANHEGVTFYTTSQAFSLNTLNCTIPAGVQPVGR